MMKKFNYLQWSCLALPLILLIGFALENQGAAQEYLVPRNAPATVEPNPLFGEFPITVEIIARIEKSNSYNILAANETKSSSTHWELFTMPTTGFLTLYAPGFTPDHVLTQSCVVDNRFHYLAATIGKDSISLYVNGECKGTMKVTAPTKEGSAAPFSVGKLTEGGFGCDGEIAIVRLSKGVRAIEPIPLPDYENLGECFTADKETIALWSFHSSQGQGGEFPDKTNSEGKNIATAAMPLALGIAEGKNITAPFIPIADRAAVAPLREQVQKLVASLGLQTVDANDFRESVWQEWKWEFDHWDKIDYAEQRPFWFDNRAKYPEQTFDENALIWKGPNGDGGPAGTILRRTNSLLDDLSRTGSFNDDFLLKNKELLADLNKLDDAYRQRKLTESDPLQEAFFLCVAAIRRKISFANPLLDFNDILCVVRGTYAGSIRSNPGTMDMQGGHFVNQYFGFNALPGGGLYRIKDWNDCVNSSGIKMTPPEVTNLLENSLVQNGELAGRKLDFGAFCTPDLDFDGNRLSFSWSGNTDHQLLFSKNRLWHIFSANADGGELTQLTAGAFDDFDSCWLPNGRLAFISERRGGYIRCFSGLVVPQFSLFSMKNDGTDIVPLSYYETSEWNPTVNNDGKIVYTRWDYTDRENCLGSRFWICGPDGTDPRAPHGNYPQPWHTFCDNPDKSDTRMGAPRVETSIRAIPDSNRYLMIGAPHHGDIDGTVCLLDLSLPDDDHMSQIKRITPEEPFPESELGMRSHFKYKTPFPLSEDYYLVTCWENLVLLDRFGNRELICDLREMPCKSDDRFRIMEPIPIRPRTRPPILPARTAEDYATISVMNVYESDQPMPEGVKIKWLRVVQNILKCNPEMGEPMIGYERENTPRIPLGIVPVEEDGSVYFEAPIAKELIFQVLDENFMAVQSMRSVAYVHPGEHLSCTGCHESNWAAGGGGVKAVPLALQREPSRLTAEVGAIEPISYYRQIKPIFDSLCVDCHSTMEKSGEKTGPTDMSYEALKEDYTFWFSGAMLGGVNSDYSGIHGGTRSIPGRFGARYCKIGGAMQNEQHQNAVPEETRRMVNLWLDCNSLRLTAFHREAEQLQGELVWPYLDVDPANPAGTETRLPGLKRNFWHQNMEGPHRVLISSHQVDKVLILDEEGKQVWEYSCNHPQDVWMLDNGNVLVAWYYAVEEIEPDYASGSGGKVVWSYTNKAPNEIPTCQPLPNGNVLVGIVGECRLIELDRQGKIVHELQLETTEKAPHSQFRLCRKTPEGTYLVPFTAEGAVREYNTAGKIIREFPKMSTPVCAIRLPDGNTLISGGGKVSEFAPTGQIVWEVTANDIPDIAIGVFAGMQRLPNGNTIICNWNPPTDTNKAPVHFFEITNDKRVVWQVESADFGQVASCEILTPTGKVPQKRWK